ncbi:hypothetical protein KDA00_04600 [Candidatus Saccharibacteria bacterium]|nr:hypothetical protein [Candidatus Saccharibacteria bacterium]
MKLENFADINNYLKNFVPGAIASGGVYTLDRMNQIMPLLDSPQEKLKVVHIAGTSGKTSTCYYTSALLDASGSKVGLSVSPHIFQVNERVQINNQPLEEQEFCKLFKDFVNIPGIIELKPTYFEILVSFAFWVFAKLNCDYAVMEVGLGGLIDGTNVIDNPQKISVITDIGLDHTRILGDTIQKIATQKAGIIKTHNHVFTYYQPEDAMDVIQQKCAENHAILHSFTQTGAYSKQLIRKNDLPLYQQRNWLLAYQVVKYIIDRDNLELPSNNYYLETQNISIPGRMQQVDYNGKELVIDGAHNPQKLQAFVDSYRLLFPEKTSKLLVAFSEAKRSALEENLKILKTISDKIIITEFEMTMDLPHKAVPVSDLEVAAKAVGFSEILSERDRELAFELLISDDETVDIRVVIGSFYLVSSLGDIIQL